MTRKQRERKQAAIVESLRLGVSIVASCVATGIGRATFYRWLSDEDFELAVSMARMDVVQEAMAELWKQAKGHYVDEEQVVETASGPKRVRRRRWVSGKVSAVNAILRMMEKDAKELEKAGMMEQEDRGELEPRMDTNEQEWEEKKMSRFEGEEGDAGREEEGVRELKLAPIPAEDGTPSGMGGDGEGLEAGGVSRLEGEEGRQQAAPSHIEKQLSRQERRALEREAAKEEKRAARRERRKARR